MIHIKSTLYRLGTSYPGTLNDRYKVYTLQTRDYIKYHSEFPRV